MKSKSKLKHIKDKIEQTSLALLLSMKISTQSAIFEVISKFTKQLCSFKNKKVKFRDLHERH